MGKSMPPISTSAQSPRWYRFGPGLLLAIVASVMVCRFWTPHDPERPLVDYVTVPMSATGGLSAPDPTWLISQKDALGLNAGQVARLLSLTERWNHDTRGLHTELQRAAQEFSSGAPAVGERGVAIEQIQTRTAPVSELTGQLLAARRAWWDEAATVLSPAQRQQAEQAWSKRFVRRGGVHKK